MKIIAIKDMSAGNESVGEMWQETKIFESHEPIENVIKWAQSRILKGDKLQKRLTLTVADNDDDSK